MPGIAARDACWCERPACSRYVNIRTIEEARAAEVQAWIEQAAKHSGWS